MRKETVIYFFCCISLMQSCKDSKKLETTKKEVQTEISKEKTTTSLYEDLEGNHIALTDYKGKKLVVNYWATWCRPCIDEMPAMARAQQLLAEDGYIFLFASDQDVDKIKSFKEKRKFDLNFIKYNGSYADLEITALPVSIIYNKAGETVERIEGSIVWDTPEMIEKLKQLQ